MDAVDGYMTVTEAAQALGMTAGGLRSRLKRGDMTGKHVHARLWLIPVAEVERWKELGKQRTGPKPKARENGEDG